MGVNSAVRINVNIKIREYIITPRDFSGYSFSRWSLHRLHLLLTNQRPFYGFGSVTSVSSTIPAAGMFPSRIGSGSQS